MMRTRIVSFMFGFAVTGAAISHFVWRDLWIDKQAVSSEAKQKFNSLESRISKLESLAFQKSESIQDEGKI